MKSWNPLSLCLLALIGLIHQGSSPAAASSAIGLAGSDAFAASLEKHLLLPGSLKLGSVTNAEDADGVDTLPAGVSQLTPLAITQAVTHGPRFAAETTHPSVSMTIIRLKRIRAIDDLGLCSAEAAGVLSRSHWEVAESSREWLRRHSLFTLCIRLQV